MQKCPKPVFFQVASRGWIPQFQNRGGKKLLALFLSDLSNHFAHEFTSSIASFLFVSKWRIKYDNTSPCDWHVGSVQYGSVSPAHYVQFLNSKMPTAKKLSLRLHNGTSLTSGWGHSGYINLSEVWGLHIWLYSSIKKQSSAHGLLKDTSTLRCWCKPCGWDFWVLGRAGPVAALWLSLWFVSWV